MADDPMPTRCAICGTSLLDKPRIGDLCLTCEHAIAYKGDMSLLTEKPEDDEPWRGTDA